MDNEREREHRPGTNQLEPAQQQPVPGHAPPTLTLVTGNQPTTSPVAPQAVAPQAVAPQAVPVSRSPEKFEDDDHWSGSGSQRDNGRGSNNNIPPSPSPPLPPLPPPTRIADDSRAFPFPSRARTVDTQHSARPRTGIDWIVPVDEKPHSRRTVGERLQPTLDKAYTERDKYAMKARMTGYTLNAAIGIQVLLGSLTTGLAASTSGRQAAISTTILGGLSTLTASYLARARGSNEPELSITRVKDLEQFIRESEAFQLDYGHVNTTEFDERLFGFRKRFEELLGNASGERKLSTPV